MTEYLGLLKGQTFPVEEVGEMKEALDMMDYYLD